MLGTTLLAGSAFAMTSLSQGYQVAPGDDKAAEEGKCGEGSCGGDHADAAGGKAGEEGKCGEGKCGEGQCGADKPEAAGAGGKAEGEGKCGEGSCGADKHEGTAAAAETSET